MNKEWVYINWYFWFSTFQLLEYTFFNVNHKYRSYNTWRPLINQKSHIKWKMMMIKAFVCNGQSDVSWKSQSRFHSSFQTVFCLRTCLYLPFPPLTGITQAAPQALLQAKVAPAEGGTFHGSFVRVRASRAGYIHLVAVTVIILGVRTANFLQIALWSIMSLMVWHTIEFMWSRAAAKEMKWKESLPHQNTAHAFLRGREEKQRQKKSSHDRFGCFVRGLPLEMCGNVLLLVEDVNSRC